MKIPNLIWALPCCNPAVQSPWWAEVLIQIQKQESIAIPDFTSRMHLMFFGMSKYGTGRESQPSVLSQQASFQILLKICFLALDEVGEIQNLRILLLVCVCVSTGEIFYDFLNIIAVRVKGNLPMSKELSSWDRQEGKSCQWGHNQQQRFCSSAQNQKKNCIWTYTLRIV